VRKSKFLTSALLFSFARNRINVYKKEELEFDEQTVNFRLITFLIRSCKAVTNLCFNGEGSTTPTLKK
jgi:hypothetical protein